MELVSWESIKMSFPQKFAIIVAARSHIIVAIQTQDHVLLPYPCTQTHVICVLFLYAYWDFLFCLEWIYLYYLYTFPHLYLENKVQSATTPFKLC